MLEGDLTERSPLNWIGTKLAAWESTIAYPVIFQTSVADIPENEKDSIYRVVYSYIVRRAMCGLPNKSLGIIFSKVATRFLTGPSVTGLVDVFRESTAPTSRFPDDVEFTRGVLDNPVYAWFSGGRLPDLLWELELASRNRFTEQMPRPDDLTIEHILPQTWTHEWPAPDGQHVPLTGTDERTERRASIIHTLGNLTLTKGTLNTSLGNEAFPKKLAKLDHESLFVLNRELKAYAVWTEREIELRGKRLAQTAISVFPSPEAALRQQTQTDATTRPIA
jgi:hypothetical protein